MKVAFQGFFEFRWPSAALDDVAADIALLGCSLSFKKYFTC